MKSDFKKTKLRKWKAWAYKEDFDRWKNDGYMMITLYPGNPGKSVFNLKVVKVIIQEIQSVRN